MLFVDELDGDDGFRLVLGYCLPNTVINQESVTRGRELDRITHDAYAPDPIVLETSRKGRLLGSGAACDCGTR